MAAIVPPATALDSGPYRHAWWIGDPPEWEPEELAALAREMTAPEGGPAQEEGRLPSGYTYFAQFVSHELTAMGALDPLETPEPVPGPPSARTLVNRCRPRLDLQSLYGEGPFLSPQHYQPTESPRVGELRHAFATPRAQHRHAGQDADLVRTPHGVALVPEPRNDQTVMIAQLHLALIKAHNGCLAALPAGARAGPRARFLEARRVMQWHVQWLVLNDLLPRLLHESQRAVLAGMLERAARDEAVDWPFARAWADGVWLPLEFVLAGYRFGHVLPRAAYRLNDRSGGPFRLLPKDPRTPPEHHLAGGRPLPLDWTIDWDFFFDDRDGTHTQRANPFAPRVAPALGGLGQDPFLAPPLPRGSFPPQLPMATLLRGAFLGLPTGQQLARHLRQQGCDVDVHDDVREGRAPLWYYLLAEAGQPGEGGGSTLGRLGSEIVCRTLLGLVAADETSYLRVQPGWTPHLGGDGDPAHYTVGTLLRSAW